LPKLKAVCLCVLARAVAKLFALAALRFLPGQRGLLFGFGLVTVSPPVSAGL